MYDWSLVIRTYDIGIVYIHRCMAKFSILSRFKGRESHDVGIHVRSIMTLPLETPFYYYAYYVSTISVYRHVMAFVGS